MNLKNKLLSAGLAACMVVPMAMPVGAAENDTKETTLKYVVTESYEWSIHSDVNFGNDKDFDIEIKGILSDNCISVTKNVIPEGKKLSIKVNGDGENGTFTIRSKNGNGKVSIPYTVTSKGHPDVFKPFAEVLSVVAGENTKSAEMNFVLLNFPPTEEAPAEIAGNYLGYITYTASIVNA